ncbi:hypothetical protein [Parvularcula sp. IMCC14364]|uniref:hypothetical protein n=1 Tax=Parvularcula sp. IMCC14364 TaxID=3067902 RepID=UPI002742944D|nr:hypothetical protein [Parvularcula sp. IMCC14364]
MKRTTAVIIATALTGFCAVSFAQSVVMSDAFGPATTTLTVEDTRLDADQLFTKVDTDRDGVISVDEYAAQTVVRANLARFNQAVVIDGEQTFHVKVAQEATTALSPSQQTAIDAVARTEFYRISGEDIVLDKNEWIQSRLSQFAAADRDNDGLLRNSELDLYAMRIAQHQISLS